MNLQLKDHEHCWHSGSDMDSALYSQDGIVTVTHLICCHCGQTKTEKCEWNRDKELWMDTQSKHGKHSWQNKKDEYRTIFER